MNGQAIVTIGGVVGGLAKFLVSAGVRGGVATIASVLVSAAVVGVWAYAHGDFSRASSFDYLSGYVAILLTAAGTFHSAENAAGAAGAIKASLTGTGNGGTK